jgi:hypothetical protein
MDRAKAAEGGVEYDKNAGKLFVKYGIAATSAIGFGISPEVRSGLLLGASELGLKSKSEAGRFLEGAARVGVSYGSFATGVAVTAAVGPDLMLGGSLIGAAVAGPPGAFIGYWLGALAGPAAGELVSKVGNFYIDQTLNSVNLAREALRSLEGNIYLLYGMGDFRP